LALGLAFSTLLPNPPVLAYFFSSFLGSSLLGNCWAEVVVELRLSTMRFTPTTSAGFSFEREDCFGSVEGAGGGWGGGGRGALVGGFLTASFVGLTSLMVCSCSFFLKPVGLVLEGWSLTSLRAVGVIFFFDEQLENRSSASCYSSMAHSSILAAFLCLSSLKT
jgi:hypothetical protein